MDEFSDQTTVPCLGRPVEVGMLYDCWKDQLVTGVTFWSPDRLKTLQVLKREITPKCCIIAEDSLESKAQVMNIGADAKLSLLSGLIQVEGSAKYLNDKKSTKRQARVTMQYQCSTFFKQLTMDQLAVSNIEFPDIFEKGTATHVVTAVEYGADAFFVFDRKTSETEDVRKVEGNLEAIIKKIPKISIGGEANVHMKEEEQIQANSFHCCFYGDLIMESNPTTFQDAIEICRNLPELIKKGSGTDGSYGVPKKAYLYPLSKLDSRATKLVRQISVGTVAECQSLLEHYDSLNVDISDLLDDPMCETISSLKDQLLEVRSGMLQARASFERQLCNLLPGIRGAGEEERRLLDEIQRLRKSPLDPCKFAHFLDHKAKEFSCLRQYLAILKKYPCAFKPGELEAFTQDLSVKHVLGFSFGNIAQRQHPYTETIQDNLNGEVVEEDEAWDALENQWTEDENTVSRLQRQIRQFQQFADNNTDRKDLRCVLTTGTRRSKRASMESPGTIYLFKEGKKQPYQPPSVPGVPQLKDVAESEIEVIWEVPEEGKCNVTEYILYYKFHIKDSTNTDWMHV